MPQRPVDVVFNNEHTEKEILKVLFTIALKIKLQNKSNQDSGIEDFYTGNFKIPKKEIKDLCAHGMVELILENGNITGNNLYSQFNPHQNSFNILHRTNNIYIYIKFWKNKSQSYPEQKE